MKQKYIVEVLSRPNVADDVLLKQLSSGLHLNPSRAQKLLDRTPGVITKAIPEATARLVEHVLKKLEFETVVYEEQVVPSEEPIGFVPGSQPMRSARPGFEDLSIPVANQVDKPLEVDDAPEVPAPASTPTPQNAGPTLFNTAERSVFEDLSESEPEDSAYSHSFADASVTTPFADDTFSTFDDDKDDAVYTSPDYGSDDEETNEPARKPRKKRRVSLRRKLLTTAIVPTLLTIIGALAVTYFTARPALYDQLLESARNPAIATAASLSSVLEDNSNTGGIDFLQLQNTIQITRQAFARQNVNFIVATDTQGNPLSGWFAGSDAFGEDAALELAIRDQSQVAVTEGAQAARESTRHFRSENGSNIEIVAQPLIANDNTFGAIVVGVNDEAVTQQVLKILLYIFLFSLIPLALAIFFAVWRARPLTQNVLFLTNQADQLSRGDLDLNVEIESNDELEDLSQALERMRVSMKEAIDRLRKRRGN